VAALAVVADQDRLAERPPAGDVVRLARFAKRRDPQISRPALQTGYAASALARKATVRRGEDRLRRVEDGGQIVECGGQVRVNGAPIARVFTGLESLSG